MAHFDREREANVASVGEVLRLERASLTLDEIERVERRLNRFCALPSRPRPGARVAVAICLALGLLFMTAGTGLAISGFATPAARVYVHNSGRSTGPQAASPQTTTNSQRAHGRDPNPSTLDEVEPSSTSTAPDALTEAETRNQPPFTGFGAIPILVAGIVLIVTGAAVNLRARLGKAPVAPVVEHLRVIGSGR